MYWNNPVIKITWPAELDPIKQSLHNDQHCLFYDPAVDKTLIRSNQSLQDLCDWVNARVQSLGWQEFTQDQRNHYEIANLVKLNLWVHDLPVNGSVKPMLLHYIGQPQYNTGTGESRLRSLQRVPQISTVSAFVSTHVQHSRKFDHLESITTFQRFAEICQAVSGQQFLFRLTDSNAPYGLEWYEYNSEKTANITPGQDYCVAVMNRYIQTHPETCFSPEWFDTVINWSHYQNS
jgi:hypothetical protein